MKLQYGGTYRFDLLALCSLLSALDTRPWTQGLMLAQSPRTKVILEQLSSEDAAPFGHDNLAG
jgi:hypothetical protein